METEVEIFFMTVFLAALTETDTSVFFSSLVVDEVEPIGRKTDFLSKEEKTSILTQ